jgi:hypothetical protein
VRQKAARVAIETRVFDRDEAAGITELWHYDNMSGVITHEFVQDVSPIVQVNREEFKQFDERARWKDGMQKVATIPLSVWSDLRRKGIDRDKRAMRSWLNDPDNRFFRTRPGRV